jgi:hypothetical protein
MVAGPESALEGKASDAEDRSEVWVEVIKIVPQLLWVAVALGALLLLYQPLVDLIARDRVSNIQVWHFKIEFAQKQLAEIKDRAGALKTTDEFRPFKERIERLAQMIDGATLLWVDSNHPIWNIHERRALSALGIRTATNTEDAMKLLAILPYDVVISDMDRPGQVDNETSCGNGPQAKGAGCGLIKTMRRQFGDGMPPTVIYALRYEPEWGTPAYAAGITNRVDHLLNFVLDALDRRKPAA